MLLATDSLGMSAEGAFWLYDQQDRKWRYFLVTSLFNRVGPRETFLRLNKALQEKLSGHEIEDFSLFIADPNERFVKEIRRHTKTTAHVSEAHEVDVKLNGHKAKAYVYRMATGLSEGKARLVRRRFNRLYNEMVTA